LPRLERPTAFPIRKLPAKLRDEVALTSRKYDKEKAKTTMEATEGGLVPSPPKAMKRKHRSQKVSPDRSSPSSSTVTRDDEGESSIGSQMSSDSDEGRHTKSSDSGYDSASSTEMEDSKSWHVLTGSKKPQVDLAKVSQGGRAPGSHLPGVLLGELQQKKNKTPTPPRRPRRATKKSTETTITVQEPSAELSSDVKEPSPIKCMLGAQVVCGRLGDDSPDTITVNWDYQPDEDTEYDLRNWDFLTLHRPGQPGDYEASRYMLGKQFGTLDFVVPEESGTWCISIVRDRKWIWGHMAPDRKKEFAKCVNTEVTEDLVTLNTAEIVVERPRYEERVRVVPAGSSGWVLGDD